jgi:hypothetical protein
MIPSASPKQRMGIIPPSSTLTMQTDTLRKSPLGKLDGFIVDFVGKIK